jgi:hypothetical protein
MEFEEETEKYATGGDSLGWYKRPALLFGAAAAAALLAAAASP